MLERAFAAEPGQVISDRTGAYLASAANMVTFRGHQFEPLHAVHAHCYRPMPMGGKLPYDGEFQARDIMPWSGRAIITGSGSCVTSQCDFVEASFRRQSQIGSGPF